MEESSVSDSAGPVGSVRDADRVNDRLAEAFARDQSDVHRPVGHGDEEALVVGGELAHLAHHVERRQHQSVVDHDVEDALVGLDVLQLGEAQLHLIDPVRQVVEAVLGHAAEVRLVELLVYRAGDRRFGRIRRPLRDPAPAAGSVLLVFCPGVLVDVRVGAGRTGIDARLVGGND